MPMIPSSSTGAPPLVKMQPTFSARRWIRCPSVSARRAASPWEPIGACVRHHLSSSLLTGSVPRRSHNADDQLSRERQGPRAVLNAVERLANGYGDECDRIRQDLSIFEAQAGSRRGSASRFSLRGI